MAVVWQFECGRANRGYTGPERPAALSAHGGVALGTVTGVNFIQSPAGRSPIPPRDRRAGTKPSAPASRQDVRGGASAPCPAPARTATVASVWSCHAPATCRPTSPARPSARPASPSNSKKWRGTSTFGPERSPHRIPASSRRMRSASKSQGRVVDDSRTLRTYLKNPLSRWERRPEPVEGRVGALS